MSLKNLNANKTLKILKLKLSNKPWELTRSIGSKPFSFNFTDVLNLANPCSPPMQTTK